MWQLAYFTLLVTVTAQIPSLGWCPDYLPMANFNVNRFLGTWFEAERYFTVSELVSRCVTTRYEKTPEGRILVNNEITNSLTGLKRGLDGYLQIIGREGEARFTVKYSSLPVPYDTEYSILDTDYDNFALVWSCSGIGPVHTQNAWILTRERLAPSAVMQLAYAAVDRYKISRTFFVKTNQADCSILPDPAADPEEKSSDGVEVEGKHASILSDVADLVKKVSKPEKDDDRVVAIPATPKEKAAVPEVPAGEPSKPLQVSELTLDNVKNEEGDSVKSNENPEKKQEDNQTQ